MRKFGLAAAGALLLAVPSFASDGKALFEKNGCAACHKAKEDSIGPSLTAITAIYSGKGAKAKLVKFLEGTGQAIVKPGDFNLMKPSLDKIKPLSKAEKEALADFVLSHKK